MTDINEKTSKKLALTYPLSEQQFEDLYRWTLQMRLYEERLPLLYRQGKLFGGVYRGFGHEAIAVGTAYALEPQDIIAPLHRDAAAHMIRGQTLEKMYANYMGREYGPSRGRDGNVHHGDMNKNIIGMISHLGTSIPLAVGAAIGKRMQGENIVSMTYIGDGGSSIGDFHEGLNFAAVHDAPFVLVVENNQYAYSTPNTLQFRCENLVDRALGYGIKGISALGVNPVDVYQAAKEAVDHARSGKGPVLLVLETMRFKGHSEHDNFEYVPRELLEKWKEYDPIDVMNRYYTDNKLMTKKRMNEIREEVQEKVITAADWAYEQPFPEGDSILSGVYYEEDE